MATVVSMAVTQRADHVAVRMSRIVGEDAVDLEGVAYKWIDDLVSRDSQVVERQVQRFRAVPHARSSVGSVVAVDCVAGQRWHGCGSHGGVVWF